MREATDRWGGCEACALLNDERAESEDPESEDEDPDEVETDSSSEEASEEEDKRSEISSEMEAEV